MKTIIIAFVAILLISCKKENKVQTTSTVTVLREECVQQTINGQTYQICFDSLLEESRCPTNVNCIWQGAAKAKFLFKVNNQEHVVRLSTINLAPLYRTDTIVAGYQLKLVNILPYPQHPPYPGTQISAIVDITQ